MSRKYFSRFKFIATLLDVNRETGRPADDAGIQAGDVIKQINHKKIGNLRDYNVAMNKTEKGKPMLFLMKRGGQTFYVSIKVSRES